MVILRSWGERHCRSDAAGAVDDYDDDDDHRRPTNRMRSSSSTRPNELNFTFKLTRTVVVALYFVVRSELNWTCDVNNAEKYLVMVYECVCVFIFSFKRCCEKLSLVWTVVVVVVVGIAVAWHCLHRWCDHRDYLYAAYIESEWHTRDLVRERERNALLCIFATVDASHSNSLSIVDHLHRFRVKKINVHFSLHWNFSQTIAA